MLENIDNWIDEHRRQIIDELCAWVRIRSVAAADEAEEGAPFGADCAKMLDYALASARAKGFETENHAGYCGSVYYGPQNADEIGIAAHIDVVPEGSDWTHEPFTGEIIGCTDTCAGYILGRGAADDKGMGVAGLYAMQCLKELKAPLKHRIRLMLGSCEETGMSDMKYMVAQAARRNSGIKLPTLTLVPDAEYPVCYAQKGRMVVEIMLQCGDDLLAFEGGSAVNAVADRALAVLRDADDMTLEELRLDQEVQRIQHGVLIKSQGKAAHAAQPEGSVNAVGVLARALLETRCLTPATRSAMRAIKRLLMDDYGTGADIACEDEQSGRLTLTCGRARFNAGRITLTMDCRYPVTSDIDTLRARLCIRLAGLGAVLKRVSLAPAFYIDERDNRVQTLCQLYREVTGDDQAANYAMGGGTYSKVLPNAITFGGAMPHATLPKGMLPAGHGGAHGPDEVISIEALMQSVKLYAYALTRLDAII